MFNTKRVRNLRAGKAGKLWFCWGFFNARRERHRWMLKGLNVRIDKTVSFSSKHPCWWLSSAKTQMLLYICVFLDIFYQEKISSLSSCPKLLKKHCCSGSRAVPSPGNTWETCTPQVGEHWAARKQSCVSIPFGIEGFLSGLADSHSWKVTSSKLMWQYCSGKLLLSGGLIYVP